MSTYETIIQVIDPIGLHARPASLIAKAVKESGLTVMIGRKGEKLTKANSPLMLMALKIKTGETLTVSIESDDEEPAALLVAQIRDFLQG